MKTLLLVGAQTSTVTQLKRLRGLDHGAPGGAGRVLPRRRAGAGRIRPNGWERSRRAREGFVEVLGGFSFAGERVRTCTVHKEARVQATKNENLDFLS